MRKNTMNVQTYVDLKKQAKDSDESQNTFDSYERNIKAAGCYSDDLVEMNQLIFIANNLGKIKQYIETSKFAGRRESHKSGMSRRARERDLQKYHRFARVLRNAGMPTNPKVLSKLLYVYQRNIRLAQTTQRHSTRPVRAKITGIEDTRTERQRYFDEVEKATLEGVNYGIVDEETLGHFVNVTVGVAMKKAYGSC